MLPRKGERLQGVGEFVAELVAPSGGDHDELSSGFWTQIGHRVSVAAACEFRLPQDLARF